MNRDNRGNLPAGNLATADSSKVAAGTDVRMNAINAVLDPEKVAETGPILFFDGVCGLCNRFVDFTLAHDRKGRIRFAPLQGTTARSLLSPTDVESLGSVVLLDEAGKHRQSSAVVRLLRQLSPGWKILAGLLWLIPRPLRNLGYRLVAANRYRLFGKKETCRMPTPDERHRFLP